MLDYISVRQVDGKWGISERRRRRLDCDGQTGYTMHLLDDAVTQVLHQIFDRMSVVPDNMIVDNELFTAE